MRRMLAAPLAAFVLISCGGSEPASPSRGDADIVRIGTKNFTESAILGELYKQALEAAGVPADLTSIGSTEVTNAALRGGLIDMYPEYIGTLLSEVDKIEQRPRDAGDAYELAKRTEEARGFTLLAPTPFSNENALAVTRSFSRRRNVDSIADLPMLRPKPLIGAATEFQNRFEGLRGLKRLYGLTAPRFEVVNTNEGLQYPKLVSGAIQVGLVYTTDPQLISGRYVLLDDPKRIFAEQHVAPLISQRELDRHEPTLPRTLNAVSALLTTPVMQQLNAEAGEQAVEKVAHAFLQAKGLQR